MGTEGLLIHNNFHLWTLELPYRNNIPQKSCIPMGEYICMPYSSKKYPNVYHVTNVPNRSSILIHWGNFAGDIEKGYKTHVQGCILVGKTLGYINKQRAILSSRIAFEELKKYIGKTKFILKIIGGEYVS